VRVFFVSIDTPASPATYAAMFETVDRALWAEHLARVEQRIAESEGIIARQRAIIEAWSGPTWT
jgi:hypothetical protein